LLSQPKLFIPLIKTTNNMNLKKSIIMLVAGMVTIASCDTQKGKQKQSNMEMKTEIDSVSYALGVNIGLNIKDQIGEINTEMMAQALRDVFDSNPKMNEEEAGKLLNDYMMGAQRRKSEASLKEGEDFLAQNAKKKGVTTTESGLQYEVITEGNGEKPTTSNSVKVHYHGSLIDGTVFDSSVERGEPVTFGVTQVIPGWTEALQMMSVGAKWKIYLPSKIAYGERGAGGVIGPNAALIFEVELLEIL